LGRYPKIISFALLLTKKNYKNMSDIAAKVKAIIVDKLVLMKVKLHLKQVSQ